MLGDMFGNAVSACVGFLMAWFLQAVPSPVTAAHATPPPLAQSVANCGNPTYASDSLVCVDSGLLGLDRKVGEALAGLSIMSRVAPQSLVEDQEAWFRRRSRCAFSGSHAGCLSAAYSERLVVLEVLRKASPALAQGGIMTACSGAPWDSAYARIRLGDRGLATAMDAEGRVLVVALDAGPRDDWSSFVRFTTEGEVIRFSPLDRPAIECRPVPSVRR